MVCLFVQCVCACVRGRERQTQRERETAFILALLQQRTMWCNVKQMLDVVNEHVSVSVQKLHEARGCACVCACGYVTHLVH